MSDKSRKAPQLQVNIPENLRAGAAANVVSITTTMNGEVILDFIFVHPQDKQNDIQRGTLVSRVILPIKIAVDLNWILQSHLGKFKKE